MKKEDKKQTYIPKQGIMGMGDDYHIYIMTKSDRLKGVFIGAAAGIAIGYVFFQNWYFSAIIAFIAAVKLQKNMQNYLQKRRTKKLLLEFKDLLETLSASYSVGMTTGKAFLAAQQEMTDLYGKEADIVKELSIVNAGLNHNYNIEEILLNFAERSGLEDINSFANVFEVCNRKGGNLKQIVGEARSIINDKIEIEMEIQTMVAASKNELNIMMVMPLIIMISMRGFGDTMTGNGIANVAVKMVALGIFAFAYVVGAKMVAIKL